MSKAIDDCFATDGNGQTMLSLNQALGTLAKVVSPIPDIEQVGLADAVGRVLASDLIAPLPVPAFDNTGVDGWAARLEDIAAAPGRALPVAGRIAAGHPLSVPALPGRAYRIFTGAPLPPGLDTVAMQEDCTLLEDGRIAFPADLSAGVNIRRAGEAMKAGAVALRAGTRLGAQHYGVAASLGVASLGVRRVLKIGILATGDELRAPGEPLPVGCIYDSNRFTLMAMLARPDAHVTDYGIIPDNLETLKATLRRAAEENDLVVTSGGVSVGEEDHVKTAVQTLGRLHLWRIAMKPGKPLAFGQIGDSLFLGLPGNPVAVAVTCALVARPLLAAMAGETYSPPRRFQLPAAFHLNKRAGRQEFPRARIVPSPFGDAVELFPSDSSGILASLSGSDGMVDLPREGIVVEPGDMVSFIPFSEVLS